MARDIFATLDLNLLRTLQILHQEQNMRRAADSPLARTSNRPSVPIAWKAVS